MSSLLEATDDEKKVTQLLQQGTSAEQATSNLASGLGAISAGVKALLGKERFERLEALASVAKKGDV